MPAPSDRGKRLRRDVSLPEPSSYRVRKVGQKTSLQGRDQTYLLPSSRFACSRSSRATRPHSRRGVETFADLDQRAFEANLFVVIGTSCSCSPACWRCWP
jgi:hypothetical protein